MKILVPFIALSLALHLNTSAQQLIGITSPDDEFNDSGGVGELQVSTYPNLRWKAESTVPWINLTDKEWKQGSNTLTYSIESNQTSDLRIGNIKIIQEPFEYEWEEPSTIADDVRLGSAEIYALPRNGAIYISYGTEESTLPARGKLKFLYRFQDSNEWGSMVVDPLCHASSSSMGSIEIKPGKSFIAIAYNDDINNMLKLAYYDGDTGIWNREEIDKGKFQSVSYHNYYDRPSIAYHSVATGDLKFAIREVDPISGNAQWSVETVDSIGDYDYRTKFLELKYPHTPNEGPAIVYHDRNQKEIKYATLNENNQWIIETVASNYGDGVTSPCLRFDPILGHAAISLYGGKDGNFKLEYHHLDKGIWKKETVDVLTGTLRYASRTKLIFDSSGYPHIAYQALDEEKNGITKYAHFNGNEWIINQIEGVDSGNNISTDRSWSLIDGTNLDAGIHDSFERPNLIFTQGANGQKASLKLMQANKRKIIGNILDAGSEISYLIPENDSLGNEWTKPSSMFDDSTWKKAVQPVGFETAGGDLEPLIKTNISEEMKTKNASGYFRFPFEWDSNKSELQLSILSDDGYIAYLNGIEISKFNAPEIINFDSRASSSRNDDDVIENRVIVDLTPFLDHLIEGQNVIAIQAMHTHKSAGDFIIGIELKGKVLEVSPVQLSISQNPKATGPIDSDNDGFTNDEEIKYGSNPFGENSFPITINPTQKNIDSLGETQTLTITASNNTNWNAKSSSPWIKIIEGSQTSGNGNINYAVNRNTENKSRKGYIKITESESEQKWITTTIDNLGTLPDGARLATSLGHNNLGLPAIAYFDYGEQAIKYSQYDGNRWSIEKVDTIGRTERYFTISLSHSPSDEPAIAYFDNNSLDLMYATRTEGVWNVEKITSNSSFLSVANYYTPSLAHYSDGSPIIAYHDISALPITSLNVAEKKNNDWQISIIDRGQSDSTGAYTSLDLDPSGNPGIAYFYNKDYNLRFAKRESNSWKIQTADSERQTGVYNSLDFKPDGSPAISYKDYGTNSDLRYAVYQNNNWDIQTVDNQNSVGAYSSLNHNSLGFPSISYRDSTNQNLKCAVYNGEKWNIYNVDSAGDVGRFTSLKFARNDAIHISYISHTDGSLRFAEFKPNRTVYHLIEQASVNPELDSDGDGLRDIVETNTGVFESMEDTGTDPFKADTDGDGISDSWELGLDRFSLVIGPKTWTEAFDHAVAKGKNLATFTTEYEMDNALSSISLELLDNFRGIWIGATDSTEEGKWMWVTGEELKLNRWAQNQPDNFLEADAAEIGAGFSSAPGKLFDIPKTVSRDAYLLETGYPSDPHNPDTDGDGFTDGDEFLAASRPDDANDKPNPSPILEDIVLSVAENGTNKQLTTLNPSHPNDDQVTISIVINPDPNGNGIAAFTLVDNNVQMNDPYDFDHELQSNIELTLSAKSQNSIPTIATITVEIIDDRNEDFDGDGLTEAEEEDDYQTSDLLADSDGDGLMDSYELGVDRFEIIKGSFKWNAAVNNASTRGGHLATFETQVEWESAVKSFGPKPFDDFSGIWIGLVNKDEWRWINENPISFDKWAQREPRNYDKAILVGERARGRTAGLWYAQRNTSNADGYVLEIGYPTNPAVADTDGDGVNDKEESDSGTNPLIPDVNFIGDTDQDGWKDEVEVLFGSSPDNAKSVPAFKLKVNVLEGNQIELLFPGEKGVSYSVQTSDDMKTWLSLEKMIIGQGDTVKEIFSISRDNSGYYWRVRKE